MKASVSSLREERGCGRLEPDPVDVDLLLVREQLCRDDAPQSQQSLKAGDVAIAVAVGLHTTTPPLASPRPAAEFTFIYVHLQDGKKLLLPVNVCSEAMWRFLLVQTRSCTGPGSPG